MNVKALRKCAPLASCPGMSQALSSAPEVYLQLAVFRDGTNVLWTGTLPTELPQGLLSACIFAFNASKAISTALLPAWDVKPGQGSEKTEASNETFVNEQDIPHFSPNDAIAIRCQNEHIIAGIPLETDVWLGFFARGFPPMLNVDVCTLLARIALAIELIPALGDSRQLKLDHFWCVLQQHMHLQQGKEIERISSTMQYLHNLSGASVHTRISVKTNAKTYKSPFSKSDVVYATSVVDTLREGQQQERLKSWITAACLFSVDGYTLLVDGISKDCASVLSWRYRSFSESEKMNGKHEIKSGVILRSWFTLGPIYICIIHSQDAEVQIPPISDIELSQVKKKGNQVLLDVTKHYQA